MHSKRIWTVTSLKNFKNEVNNFPSLGKIAIPENLIVSTVRAATWVGPTWGLGWHEQGLNRVGSGGDVGLNFWQPWKPAYYYLSIIFKLYYDYYLLFYLQSFFFFIGKEKIYWKEMPKERLKVYNTYTPTAKLAKKNKKISAQSGQKTTLTRAHPITKTN